MTQEQIEKVANDYACKQWADGGFRYVGRDGFIAGAQWRIDSVWHDRTEDASMGNGDIILVFSDGSAMTRSVIGWNWKDILERFAFVRWAYIKDLIPTEE